MSQPSSEPQNHHWHAPALSPARAALFAGALLALGFVIGYGFRAGVAPAKHESAPSTPTPTATSLNTATPAPSATPKPVVKGLRVSPDGKKAAFALVVENQRAYRVLIDLATQKMEMRPSPVGWQDYLVQWSADGKTLLFDREKIPRAVDDATPGLYAENIQSPTEEPRALAPRKLFPTGEKTMAGFWMPDGTFIVKTRREPKAMYRVLNGRAQRLDEANITYAQNRAMRENGKLALYVVRDFPGGARNQSALFRVENGAAKRLSESLGQPEWVYVAEGARWMIVCRDADENNWRWELYAVSPRAARRVKSALVTKDISGVFWSPDGKSVLGASGKSLWLVSVPQLQTRKLGARSDWNADDASWISAGNERGNILVAARGALWIVNSKSGAERQIASIPTTFSQKNKPAEVR